MHGTIFSLLKRYVQTQYDHSTWLKLVELAGLDSSDFSHRDVYPDAHLYALVGQAAEMTGIPAGELHEKFGEYLVPDLMYMYQKKVTTLKKCHLQRVRALISKSKLGRVPRFCSYFGTGLVLVSRRRVR